MTRRERKENRLARRLDWAVGREQKAASLHAYTERYRGDVAFNTQPGHIPERARVIRATDRACEHSEMADHHRAVADGIAHQLDTSIFSDDHDAVERLRERIAGLEADRDRQKAANKEIKRGPGWVERLAAAGITLTERDTADLMSVARHQPYLADKKTGLPVFPAYHFQNLGANILRLKKRLATIGATAAQRAQVREVLEARS